MSSLSEARIDLGVVDGFGGNQRYPWAVEARVCVSVQARRARPSKVRVTASLSRPVLHAAPCHPPVGPLWAAILRRGRRHCFCSVVAGSFEGA